MTYVSIITATYNSSRFIIETYESILSQTFTSWEWLITDDCSKDKTWKILNEIQNKDKRVKIWRNEINSGPAIARNNSIKNSRGKYIAFIDADDLWVPKKLEKQLEFMDSKNINFSFTAYEIISEDGNSLNKYIDRRNVDSFSYEDMLRKKATLGCSTVMLKRKAFDDIKMLPLRVGQDYALWLKLLKLNEKAYLLNFPLTKYRIVSDSISRNKQKKAKMQWFIYRNIEKLNIMKSIECFLFYAFHAIFR